jgi:hypothetical protein
MLNGIKIGHNKVNCEKVEYTEFYNKAFNRVCSYPNKRELIISNIYPIIELKKKINYTIKVRPNYNNKEWLFKGNFVKKIKNNLYFSILNYKEYEI